MPPASRGFGVLHQIGRGSRPFNVYIVPLRQHPVVCTRRTIKLPSQTQVESAKKTRDEEERQKRIKEEPARQARKETEQNQHDSFPRPPRSRIFQSPFFRVFQAPLFRKLTSPLVQMSKSPFFRTVTWYLFFTVPPFLFFVMHVPLAVMFVSGPSMSPFFNANSSPELPETRDCILIERVKFPESPISGDSGTSRWEPQRGQIVVFYKPHDPRGVAIKRVVGVPGDRIKPLPGYPGGDEPVVVPFNHIWVEGDVNDRAKSVDSNWYGPISRRMVIGHVLMVLTPWHSPVFVNWQEDDYPAKNSGRVEKNVVHDAKVDPDEKASGSGFHDGSAELELAAMRRNRPALPAMMRDQRKFAKLRQMYAEARTEVERQDPGTQQVAQGLIDELEVAFEAVGLSKDGNVLPPALRGAGTQPDQGIDDKRSQRLREYLDRQQKDPKQLRNDGPRLLYLGI